MLEECINGFYDTALMSGTTRKMLSIGTYLWDYGKRWVDWKGVSIKEMEQVFYIDLFQFKTKRKCLYQTCVITELNQK